MSYSQPPRPPRAFFGRRKGHPLRPRQAELFDTLLPRLALDLTSPAPADLGSLFTSAPDIVRLEIGFGGGENLVREAQADPAAGFIGCEPFVNGMAKALAGIAAHGIENIRLHHGDAAELLAWLPDGALAGIDLVHPDPWPKRRHWKRRFVQDASIRDFARVLKPGGRFRFATDWPDYAAWTLERFLRADAFEWTAARADDWRNPWPGFLRTRYHEKAAREGRAPCFLVFRRRP
jgi:tRNA (guanine-N7-)-methyltransferase